jgi:hypothetical protein
LNQKYAPSLSKIRAYFLSERVNSGLLKAANNPRTLAKALEEREEEERTTPRHFIIGGAIDAKLTTTKAIFEKEYAYVDCIKPGGKMKVFID